MLRSIFVHIDMYLAVYLSQQRCTPFFGNNNIIEFWFFYPEYADLLNFATNCTTQLMASKFSGRKINVTPAWYVNSNLNQLIYAFIHFLIKRNTHYIHLSETMHY